MMPAILIIESPRLTASLQEQVAALTALPITVVVSSGHLHVFLVPSPDTGFHVDLLEKLGACRGAESVETAWLSGAGAFRIDDATRQAVPWFADKAPPGFSGRLT
jgi:hypothetical protein